MAMTPPLYAFWKYETEFPYVLGAPVDTVLKSGLVRVEGYGASTFRPVLLLPLEAGQELHTQLRQLSKQYTEEKVALRQKYLGVFNMAFPVKL